MNFDPRRYRKLDFVLVVAAILLLWGPGVTLLPDGARRGGVVQASPAATGGRTCCQTCGHRRLASQMVTPPRSRGAAAVQATITGYSSTLEETGSTLGVTASGTTARHGVIALSQDLLREYTPGAPFTFHDRVEIPGVGSFSVEDTMHPRWTNRADIWFSSREEALQWGRRSRYLYKMPRSTAEALSLPGKSEVAATFGQANFQ